MEQEKWISDVLLVAAVEAQRRGRPDVLRAVIKAAKVAAEEIPGAMNSAVLLRLQRIGSETVC